MYTYWPMRNGMFVRIKRETIKMRLKVDKRSWISLQLDFLIVIKMPISSKYHKIISFYAPLDIDGNIV